MTLKHKVIQDYQFVSSDKKIIVLKTNTILENYVYSPKGGDSIKIDKDIIENNSTFFKVVDWKEELHSYIKSNKIPQPAILTKKIIPFIDEMFVAGQSKTQTTSIKNDIYDDELKFKESQIEAKSKRLELLEKQLLEEQQKLTEKEIDFLRKEKVISERLKDIESNNLNQTSYNKDLEDFRKKQLELLSKEKELFEKESRLEMLELKEKKFLSEQNELNLKLEELRSKEKSIREKEAQLKTVDVDDIVIREINLESLEKKIELKEKQLKVDVDDIKNKEFFLLQKEKNLNEKESEIKKKEIDLNKKESDLNIEEINLLELSTKLEILEKEIFKRQQNISAESIEKIDKLIDHLKSKGYLDPGYEQTLNSIKSMLSSTEF